MSLIDYQKYIRPGVIKEDIIELKEIFDLFDEDGSGSIEPKELIEAFEKGNYKIDKRVIYQIMAEMDTDGSGSIEFDEFVQVALQKDTREKTMTEAKKLFQIFDLDRGGTVSIKELARITRELGLTKNEEELNHMFKKADLDNDGMLSVQDFHNILTGKGYV